MSRNPARACLAMAVLLICSAALMADDAQEAKRQRELGIAPQPGSASFQTWSALNRSVEIKAEGTPLKEVVEQIAKQIDVSIGIDEKGLQWEGLTSNEPVTLTLVNVRARTALHALLEPLELEMGVKLDGRIVIDSANAKQRITVRVYLVADLLDWTTVAKHVEPTTKVDQLNSLRDLVVSTISPESWNDLGGSGFIVTDEVNLSLAVRQTLKVHTQTAELLEQLRQLKNLSVVDPDVAADNEQLVAAIKFKLSDTRMTLEESDVPLGEVVQKIAMQTSLNFVLDVNGLNEEGLTSKSHVTIDAKDEPVAKLLTDLLKPLNLDYVVEDEVVKVTSRLRAMGPATIIVYPVGKLLSPTQDENESISIRKLSKLADEIQKQVAPDFWDSVGGIGTVTFHEATGSLVIRQVTPVHEEIQAFLETKKSAKEQN